MGRSGNPAKTARQGTIDEVRAGALAGRSMLIRPFPETEVVLRTTDPDQAEHIVRALQPITSDVYDGEFMLVQMAIFFARIYQLNPDDAREWIDTMHGVVHEDD